MEAEDATVADIGCADGTRDALAGFADIAACSGAWLVGGVINPLAPGCERQAGNDGVVAAGTACNVSDLCQEGWHVCNNSQDVALHDGASACEQLTAINQVFFVTRQSGSLASMTCAGVGDLLFDDVYGCGTLGQAVTGCGPINRKLGLPSYCNSNGFDCGTDDEAEGMNVVKDASSNGGGALCCRD